MAKQAIKYQDTTVDVEKTVGELSALIKKYGGSRFETAWTEDGGVGGEQAAHAHAEQTDAGRVNLGAGQQPVQDGGDHFLPVGAEDQAVQVEGGGLAGAVEGEHVVSPLDAHLSFSLRTGYASSDSRKNPERVKSTSWRAGPLDWRL